MQSETGNLWSCVGGIRSREILVTSEFNNTVTAPVDEDSSLGDIKAVTGAVTNGDMAAGEVSEAHADTVGGDIAATADLDGGNAAEAVVRMPPEMPLFFMVVGMVKVMMIMVMIMMMKVMKRMKVMKVMMRMVMIMMMKVMIMRVKVIMLGKMLVKVMILVKGMMKMVKVL